MRRFGSTKGYRRPRREHERSRVTNIELFFDLVFVFAVTQLSRFLLLHFEPAGAIEAGLILFGVWWVWSYTAWFTNWLDPDVPPVRLALLPLILLGLVFSTSIPEAFSSRGIYFAGAYVAMQIGRSLFTLWAIGPGSPDLTRNMQRILAWFSVSGMLWIAGGAAEGPARFALWMVALAFDYTAPSVRFWTPGLGRFLTRHWTVEGGHVGERCALFIIIALGESVLDTGLAFTERAWSFVTVGAFIAAFVGSIALWWIYFDTGAERGVRHVTRASDPGRVAALVYSYLHVLAAGGVILAAAADDLMLAAPGQAGECGVGHRDPWRARALALWRDYVQVDHIRATLAAAFASCWPSAGCASRRRRALCPHSTAWRQRDHDLGPCRCLGAHFASERAGNAPSALRML